MWMLVIMLGSVENFCFIVERGLDRDNDTERQRNKNTEKKREMGKMKA